MKELAKPGAKKGKTLEVFRLDDLPRPIAIGTWAWGGNTATFGPGGADVKGQEEAFRQSLICGVNFFDTAEVYSNGASETLLGNFIHAEKARAEKDKPKAKEGEAEEEGEEGKDGKDGKEGKEGKEDLLCPLVATKFIPLPWRIRARSVREALLRSLTRMKLPYCDLYQIHGPAFSVRAVEVWAEALADVYDEGLVRAVGVSNYNSDQVKRTHAVLQRRGVRLESNQIEYSLLHRLPEATGLIKTCQELGVKILAYSPLAMGRLTGKYSKDNPPSGDRKFGVVDWDVLDKLITIMKKIGEKHEKNCAQVAINWVIQKGCVPITGARDGKQAKENAGATGWALSQEEVEELDKASFVGTTSRWQGSSR